MLAKPIGAQMSGSLSEHNNKTKTLLPDGFHTLHTQERACHPLFDKTINVGQYKEEITRLIVEAEHIDAPCDLCISKPPIALYPKELGFLRKRCQLGLVRYRGS